MTLVTENQRVSVTEAYSDQSVIEQIRRLKKLKQDKLTAGENITIEGNVISAAGGSEAAWGSIIGDLDDQTDLKEELTGIVDRIDDNAEAIEALDTAKADVGASYTKGEEDALLAAKADVGTAYTKAEADALLSGKADASNVYTKAQTYDKQEIDFNFNWVDSQLSTKADQLSVDAAVTILNSVKQNKLTAGQNITIVDDVISATGGGAAPAWGDITGTLSNQTDLKNALDGKEDAGTAYTKAQTDALLNNKADTYDTYTKDETDVLLSYKADSSALSSHMSNTSNPHQVSKAQVGLGNVDNTSDLSKPISTATQTALNGKADVGASYTKAEEDALLAAKASTAQLITGLNGKRSNKSVWVRLSDGINGVSTTNAVKIPAYTAFSNYNGADYFENYGSGKVRIKKRGSYRITIQAYGRLSSPGRIQCGIGLNNNNEYGWMMDYIGIANENMGVEYNYTMTLNVNDIIFAQVWSNYTWTFANNSAALNYFIIEYIGDVE